MVHLGLCQALQPLVTPNWVGLPVSIHEYIHTTHSTHEGNICGLSCASQPAYLPRSPQLLQILSYKQH